MKKLQIQERVVDEVKLAIKPFYSGKKIDKNEYKEILRKAVPKVSKHFLFCIKFNKTVYTKKYCFSIMIHIDEENKKINMIHFFIILCDQYLSIFFIFEDNLDVLLNSVHLFL